MGIRERVRAGALAPAAAQCETVSTEWGPVLVREMTGADFDIFLEGLRSGPSKPDSNPGRNGTPAARAPSRVRSVALVVACCYDPDTDERIFDVADVAALAGQPWGELMDLYAAAERLNTSRLKDETEAERLGKAKGGAAAGDG